MAGDKTGSNGGIPSAERLEDYRGAFVRAGGLAVVTGRVLETLAPPVPVDAGPNYRSGILWCLQIGWAVLADSVRSRREALLGEYGDKLLGVLGNGRVYRTVSTGIARRYELARAVCVAEGNVQRHAERADRLEVARTVLMGEHGSRLNGHGGLWQTDRESLRRPVSRYSSRRDLNSLEQVLMKARRIVSRLLPAVSAGG